MTLARYPSNVIAEIDGEIWSYVVQVDRGQPGPIDFRIAGKEELYRLRQDPRQQFNGVAEHAEIADDPRARLLDWYAQNRLVQLEGLEAAESRPVPSQPPILSANEMDALKALGYVGE
jgi:hypothetical protein